MTPLLEGGVSQGDLPTLIRFGGGLNALTPSSLPGPLVLLVVLAAPVLVLSLLIDVLHRARHRHIHVPHISWYTLLYPGRRCYPGRPSLSCLLFIYETLERFSVIPFSFL